MLAADHLDLETQRVRASARLRAAIEARDIKSREALVARAERLLGLYSIQDKQERDRLLRADAILCKRGLPAEGVTGFEYWCSQYGWVRSEKSDAAPEQRDIPFELWPSQVELSRWLDARTEAGDLCISIKSRDCGVTWLDLHKLYYLWQHHGTGSMLGSRIEDDVDKKGDPGTLFSKLRYIRDRQPGHIRERRVIDTHMLLQSLRHKGTISGQSTTGNFARSKRARILFIDEFPAIEANIARNTLSAIQSVAGSTWLNGTPQGTLHPAYELVQELAPHKIRLMDWHADPHRPSDFRELMTRPIGDLSDAVFDREYGCSFTATLAGNLIWQTVGNRHVYREDDPRWVPHAAALRARHQVITGWDFGSGASLLVCLFALIEFPPQPAKEGQLPRIWIDDELVWKSEHWRTAAVEVRERVKADGYGGPIQHFGDPAGVQRESDQQSWQSNLRAGGIMLNCLPDWVNTTEGREWAIREVQRYLDTDLVRIHERCRHTLAAVREWQRQVDPFVRLDALDKEYVRPRHDIHSHPGMALLYLLWAVRMYHRVIVAQRAGRAPADPKLNERTGTRLPVRVVGDFAALLRGDRP